MEHQHSSSGWRYSVPEGVYTERVTVRSYEARRDGRVHVGTMMRYLEHLATRASAFLGFDHVWYEQHASAWVVREMKVWMGVYPTLDTSLVLATWLSETRRVQAMREYAAWDEKTGVLAARGQARWAYVNRTTGQILRIPDQLQQRFIVLGHPFTAQQYERHFAATGGSPAAGGDSQVTAAGGRLGEGDLRLRARDYEVDTQQHVNNCVYADWFEEAYLGAAHSRIAGSDGAIVQSATEKAAETLKMSRLRYLHIEYLRPVLAGQDVQIRTGIVQPHRLLHIVHQTIKNRSQSDGAAPAVRARTVYLTLPASQV